MRILFTRRCSRDRSVCESERAWCDFWVLQQTFTDEGEPDKRIYRYWLLYTVPREQIEDAIERALNEEDQKNKPKTEEEKVARDRVKELFDEGL